MPDVEGADHLTDGIGGRTAQRNDVEVAALSS